MIKSIATVSLLSLALLLTAMMPPPKPAEGACIVQEQEGDEFCLVTTEETCAEMGGELTQGIGCTAAGFGITQYSIDGHLTENLRKFCIKFTRGTPATPPPNPTVLVNGASAAVSTASVSGRTLCVTLVTAPAANQPLVVEGNLTGSISAEAETDAPVWSTP